MAKIWIADDDLFYRKIILEGLENRGHDVMTMDNGMTLLQVLEEDRPDLMVLDVFMAQKDGIELLREMNLRAKTKGEWPIPVILITGDDSEETERAAREAKADFYLLKPFSEEELFEVISRLLIESKRRKRLQRIHQLRSEAKLK